MQNRARGGFSVEQLGQIPPAISEKITRAQRASCAIAVTGVVGPAWLGRETGALAATRIGF